MRLSRTSAEIFIPDGMDPSEALARTTHLGVGAHQDDLEIMATEGILECFQRPDRWFTGVVLSDGRGSPRDDLYASHDDEQMRQVRFKEQRKAAIIGEYAAQVLLDHPSSTVKDAAQVGPRADLTAILAATRPQVVYTHNLADKHDTHVAVALRLIEALRALAPEDQPARLLGCEVWRDLDWLNDDEKICMDTSPRENLQAALVGVFDSQICGGKRYDLAIVGRRRAQATFFASHAVDATTSQHFAMDLKPLITDPDLDPEAFIQGFIQRFASDVRERLARLR